MYEESYIEKKGLSESHLNEAQRTLHFIAENMKLQKKISEEGYSHFQQAIEALEQEPKTGYWIHRTQDGGCFWEECSVCHTERAFPTKYCPDCGTYMYADIRTDAPTIIEADKSERSE